MPENNVEIGFGPKTLTITETDENDNMVKESNGPEIISVYRARRLVYRGGNRRQNPGGGHPGQGDRRNRGE